MAKTKIEWTEMTWNPVTGCSPISEGCRNCYAERMSKRLAGRYGYPNDEPFRVTVHPDRLEEPLKWWKPRRVFVCSMGDLFHEDVGYSIVDIFDVMSATPQHTYLLLTKRPEKMRSLFRLNGPLVGREPLPNVWLGVTAENQEMADERIPILLDIPAAVRFVSVEPMLGPVHLNQINTDSKAITLNTLTGTPYDWDYGEWMPEDNIGAKIDWVICGCESGPGARPMHPDWVRCLRDQCQDADVPFFFKGWGDWLPVCGTVGEKHEIIIGPNGDITEPFEGMWKYENDIGYQTVAKIGKKWAGRDLDGREWNEKPGDSDDGQ